MQMWKLATPKSAGWARSLETWEEPSYSSSSVGMSYLLLLRCSFFFH